MTPYARDFTEAGLLVSQRDYFASLTRTGVMGQELTQALRGIGLLICSTTALPAVSAEFNPGSGLLSNNGQPVDPMLGWVMTVPFNMLSTKRALAVPCGQEANSIPLGSQIIGQLFDDDSVFRLQTH